MITLMNCKVYLEVLGIYMERIGSGALFTDALTQKMPYISWEYDFAQDSLKIWVEDGIEIPNLSEFGEVVSYEPNFG